MMLVYIGIIVVSDIRIILILIQVAHCFHYEDKKENIYLLYIKT